MFLFYSMKSVYKIEDVNNVEHILDTGPETGPGHLSWAA